MFRSLLLFLVAAVVAHGCACDNDCPSYGACFPALCLEGVCTSLIDIEAPNCRGLQPALCPYEQPGCNPCVVSPCQKGQHCDSFGGLNGCTSDATAQPCSQASDCALYTYGDCVTGYCTSEGYCTALASCGVLDFTCSTEYCCQQDCTLLGSPISAGFYALETPPPLTPCVTRDDCNSTVCQDCIQSQCVSVDPSVCSGALLSGLGSNTCAYLTSYCGSWSWNGKTCVFNPVANFYTCALGGPILV